MAKQFKPKTSGATVLDTTAPEETTVNSDTVEEGVENTVDTVDTVDTVEDKVEEVVANESIVQKSPVKNVKILPKCDHTCCIGGTRYFLKKGVQTNVPQEVKDILNKSGLLMPL